ncbi:DUF1909-domain-containing protein [Moesziomyces antarcticus]|uniref:DUF1909-domain-containing protein n=1 Tax=Pseudozyma antarctica TaxID=84753 RepID=A0A081CCE2_PSEA2|nr:DUF1909-domain-containing protein [Moesziomyces antarcticus]GAK64338.1 DUF1909-domain-containing protein [Moesziomyces antarcticus]
MGNGAKIADIVGGWVFRAQQKRERNAKAAGGEAKSQKKVNEAAKNVMCMTCRQTFLLTVREPALQQHASDRHNKTLAECFPGFGK